MESTSDAFSDDQVTVKFLVPIVAGIILISLVSFSKIYTTLEVFILAVFLVVIALVGTHYFLGVNLTATVRNLFKQNPQVDFTLTQTDQTSEQVFHVPGQLDYQNAKAVCKAYGGKLATIEQITEAHKQGAEWCSYGWSEDQMGLFPTQTKTWQQLQSNPKHKMDCGRPGVNGGYIQNALQKMGANCFAPKPSQQGEMKQHVIPKPPLDPSEAYWKANLPTPDPFNYTRWDA
jgi:hypothetical protein